MSVQVVSFKCTLKNKLGTVISVTFNRDVLTDIHHPPQDRLSGLVQGLQNLKAGEKRRIEVPAESAYGFYDPQKVLFLPRAKIQSDESLRQGASIPVSNPDGGRARNYRVVEVYEDAVALDANHPLAGQDLVFEIEAMDVRNATEAEIAEARPLDCGPRLH